MENEGQIYGHHPVVEAIRSGRAIEKVFFQQGLRGEVEKEIRHLTREFDIPLAVIPREKLDRMTNGRHQGVVARLSAIDFHALDQLLPQVFERGESPLILVLDSVTDVRNFGGMARSALCLGAHAAVVPASGAAPINDDAVKSSAGALLHLPICRVRSLFSTVEFLQNSGLQVVSLALTPRSVPLPTLDLREPTALLLGSEGDGLHPKLLRMSDHTARIPQSERFDSLNVGVAAGIALYEAARQRMGFGEISKPDPFSSPE
ncbi:MAG: 23S rRNA (guanosine(2251)-2'-O)-methyltransferase RlmB [Saprospiraceae bacterium]